MTTPVASAMTCCGTDRRTLIRLKRLAMRADYLLESKPFCDCTSSTWEMLAEIPGGGNVKIVPPPHTQRRTGSSNKPSLSRQTGPITSGVTTNSGAPVQISKLSFHPQLRFPGLLLFVTLSLSPFSPLPSYTSSVNGLSRLTYFKI